MRRILVLGAAVLTFAAGASAQAPAPPGASTATGFRAEYVAEVDAVGKKLVELAQAMPADKYGWRPAPGVRSVGEIYVHVAVSDSTLPSFLGMKRMEGVSRESEKAITDKAQIVALLEKSIANARAAGAAVTDADLDRKVKTYGDQEMTERQVLMRILVHMHEHLGQSIAYARMNGITPPWSKSD
jgi:uncharacterized damage-inducible protein DinB